VPAEAFAAFATPGYAKTIYALSVRRLDDTHTLLTGTMRTATTSDEARRWFRRYWTFGVGAGAHVLVQGLLDVTRDLAEGAPATPRAPAADDAASEGGAGAPPPDAY
jgi:hypothetical protein